jgi:L-rhamnose isomerase
MRNALLRALLEPRTRLLAAQERFDGTEVMALFEEQKSIPWAAISDFYRTSKNRSRRVRLAHRRERL